VKVLSRVFRGKFDAGLKRAFRRGRLSFHGSLSSLAEPKNFQRLRRQLFRHDWVVYAKRPFAVPNTCCITCTVHPPGRDLQSSAGVVRERPGYVPLERLRARRQDTRNDPLADEFLRRFMLHVLPRRFVRIRHFGFLTNRHRSAAIALCRQLMGEAPKAQPEPSPSPGSGEHVAMSSMRRHHDHHPAAVARADPRRCAEGSLH